MSEYQFKCANCDGQKVNWVRSYEVTDIYPVKTGKDGSLIPDTINTIASEGGDIFSEELCCASCGKSVDFTTVSVIESNQNI